MPRGKKNSSDIPWGKSQTEEGTALMKAIQALDVDQVQACLTNFTAEKLNEARLYHTHTRSKEEEDAHSEALPVLHVLADTEKKGNKDDSEVAKVKEIALALLKAGARPSEQGLYQSATFYSVDQGALVTSRAMLEHLVASGVTVTGGAAMIGKTRQAGTYGGHGTDIFHAAAKHSTSDMMAILFQVLKDELGPESSNDYKSSLGRMLDVACTYQALANVIFLLENGASPEGSHFDKKEDWCDWNRPLHTAANQGNPDVVQALLNAQPVGASIHTRCVNGLIGRPGGAIHFAVGRVGNVDEMEARMETVRRLLKAGCDVNQPSVMERKTPLEIAIEVGACDMIRFLIVECLCDTESKNYEHMARKHKKKSVARAFERSLQEREENGGESRVVRLRFDSGQDGMPEPVEFPKGGDLWTWDGETGMFQADVQFDPNLGLYNGDDHLEKLKEVHGGSGGGIISLEDEDGASNQSDSQKAADLAKEMAEAMKDEALKSETDAHWHPFWVLSSHSGSDESASKRSGRRSRRTTGPPPETLVKTLFGRFLELESEADLDEKTTVEVLDQASLSTVLELGKRSPALKACSRAIKEKMGNGKIVTVVLQGEVIFPIFVGFLVGEDAPCFAGVYSHKVET